MNELHRRLAHRGLYRPADSRVLGGVCAGLGRRFGVDPWPARLIFVLLLMVVPGSQLLVYPLLWLVMPHESRLDEGVPDQAESQSWPASHSESGSSSGS